MLISEKPIAFQVPVMLNPGEILSIGNNTNPFLGEGTVHLQLNAIVKKSCEKNYSLGIQTEEVEENKEERREGK